MRAALAALALTMAVLAGSAAEAQTVAYGTTRTTEWTEGRPSDSIGIDLKNLGTTWRPYAFDNAVPACDSGFALSHVMGRFSSKEAKFWDGTVAIDSIDKVQELAPRATGVNNIPRRYCVGRALMSTGKYHTVRYVVAEDQGMIGFLAGVTSCVVGYDRNWAYGPDCRTLRP